MQSRGTGLPASKAAAQFLVASHEQKNGSLGCIYKDVLFSTTNAMKPTNERLAGLETTLPCSLLATAHPHDTTSAVLSSGLDRHQ